MKTINIDIDLGIDTRFWALLPAVNLNFCNGFSLELEFLCFSFYANLSRI